ncbi:hypothetical protein [Amycolatopsis speibonae]|uniref:Tetratricopeptide repeat protein n=1 Tax=Amycolatopsis speibonae TaxID=1450224 RepID=A0ABV7P4D8_9PSEU
MTELTELLDEALEEEPWPGDVELAVALSIAATIEPELVRAVRLGVLTSLDVGAEADFWFSAWIGRRQPDTVLLAEELLPGLREALAGRLSRAAAGDPIRRLRGVVAAVHRSLPSALRLEESVTWLAFSDSATGLNRAAKMLYRPLRSLADGENDPLADWVIEARRRLPAPLLEREEAWHLTLMAKAKRPYDVIPAPCVEDLLSADLLADDSGAELAGRRVRTLLGPVAREFPDRRIALRWDGDDLLVGGTVEGATLCIEAHDVTPLMLKISSPGLPGRWYDVSGGPPRRHRSAGREVVVHTVDGDCFEVPRPVGTTVQASPVLVTIAVAEGRGGSYWLQPVSYRDSPAPRRGQPSVLLNRALRAATSRPYVHQELRTWQQGTMAAAVMLLSGGDHATRIQLADRFAAECEAADWTVFRARQDPETAPSLIEQLPGGPHGILVVVDRADTWHPQHLVGLVDVLQRAASGPLRVLTMAPTAGAWWQECHTRWAQRRVYATRKVIATRDVLDPTPEMVFARCLDVMREELPDAPRPAPARPAVSKLSVAEVPLIAVAAVLAPSAGTLPDARRAVVAVLDHEARYRRGETPGETDAVLSRLCFVTALVGPCTHQVAQKLALDHGLIREPAEWTALSDRYRSFYPGENGFLPRPGPPQLADALVQHSLSGSHAELGEPDAAWAAGLLSRLPATGERNDGMSTAMANALVMLARLSTDSYPFYLGWVKPLLQEDPGFACRHGGEGLGAVVGLAEDEVMDLALLDRIRSALPAPSACDVSLDQAILRLETLLVNNALRRTARTDPALQLRLGVAQHRAGYLRAAQAAVTQAVEGYRWQYAAKAVKHADALCEALITCSRIHGELGETRKAYELAAEAERRVRELKESTVGVNSGTALANLAARKIEIRGDHGAPALADARRAVDILTRLVDNDLNYRPDLAAALPVLSDALAASGAHTEALAQAEKAVKHCRQLTEVNPWAHQHLLASAHECHSARLAETDRVREALDESHRAVELFDRVARASPGRFRPAVAEARLRHAELLFRSDSDETDRRAAAEAAVSVLRTLSEGTSIATDLQRRRVAALGIEW